MNRTLQVLAFCFALILLARCKHQPSDEIVEQDDSKGQNLEHVLTAYVQQQSLPLRPNRLIIN